MNASPRAGVSSWPFRHGRVVDPRARDGARRAQRRGPCRWSGALASGGTAVGRRGARCFVDGQVTILRLLGRRTRLSPHDGATNGATPELHVHSRIARARPAPRAQRRDRAVARGAGFRLGRLLRARGHLRAAMTGADAAAMVRAGMEAAMEADGSGKSCRRFRQRRHTTLRWLRRRYRGHSLSLCARGGSRDVRARAPPRADGGGVDGGARAGRGAAARLSPGRPPNMGQGARKPRVLDPAARTRSRSSSPNVDETLPSTPMHMRVVSRSTSPARLRRRLVAPPAVLDLRDAPDPRAHLVVAAPRVGVARRADEDRQPLVVPVDPPRARCEAVADPRAQRLLERMRRRAEAPRAMAARRSVAHAAVRVPREERAAHGVTFENEPGACPGTSTLRSSCRDGFARGGGGRGGRRVRGRDGGPAAHARRRALAARATAAPRARRRLGSSSCGAARRASSRPSAAACRANCGLSFALVRRTPVVVRDERGRVLARRAARSASRGRRSSASRRARAHAREASRTPRARAPAAEMDGAATLASRSRRSLVSDAVARVLAQYRARRERAVLGRAARRVHRAAEGRAPARRARDAVVERRARRGEPGGADRPPRHLARHPPPSAGTGPRRAPARRTHGDHRFSEQ